MLDCVISGVKLKTGNKVNKDTGKSRFWTDIYTVGGNTVRVWGFDTSNRQDFEKLVIAIEVLTFDDGLYFRFVKEVK